jgi:superfamily II DNA or RNA helicase
VSGRVRLRPWQHAGLTAFSRAEGQDFLAVATPGAGKTTFALVAARLVLAERPSRLQRRLDAADRWLTDL